MLLVVVALALGLPGLAAAGHLGLLALASLAYREPRPRAHEDVRFLVLVPAHNEAPVIGRCLEAIYADARPGDMVLVVADRCTDATATVARRFGASVLDARAPMMSRAGPPPARPDSSTRARSSGTRW